MEDWTTCQRDIQKACRTVFPGQKDWEPDATINWVSKGQIALVETLASFSNPLNLPLET